MMHDCVFPNDLSILFSNILLPTYTEGQYKVVMAGIKLVHFDL